MSSQVFKNKVPNELLFALLDEICVKNDKCYISDKSSFKKGLYEEKIQQFLKDCIPYYHVSKQQYLVRKLTYNTFTTVLRQICKSNHIVFTSHFKYDKSEYEIVYNIYY